MALPKYTGFEYPMYSNPLTEDTYFANNPNAGIIIAPASEIKEIIFFEPNTIEIVGKEYTCWAAGKLILNTTEGEEFILFTDIILIYKP